MSMAASKTRLEEKLETVSRKRAPVVEGVRPGGECAGVIARPNVEVIHYCWSVQDTTLRQRRSRRSLSARSETEKRLSSRWADVEVGAEVDSGEGVTERRAHICGVTLNVGILCGIDITSLNVQAGGAVKTPAPRDEVIGRHNDTMGIRSAKVSNVTTISYMYHFLNREEVLKELCNVGPNR
ncbi:hypothetical protein MMC16_005968 [Acarospora aff. strigata]|nr:hypothetical protein [Acarospora aff. strigata]